MSLSKGSFTTWPVKKCYNIKEENKMNSLLPICASLVTNLSVLSVVANEGGEWWVSLIVSLVSPFLYYLINLFGKVLVNTLEKKKLLSKEDAKKAKDELEDLTDDGKKNNSNKGD